MSKLKINKMYLFFIVVVLVHLLSIFPVYAHTPIEKVSPTAGEILETPPVTIDVWFEDHVEIYADSIVIRNENKAEVQVGKPQYGEDRRHVTVELEKDLPPGKYIVHIDVIGIDGHAIKDNYEFDVKEPQLSNEEMFQKLKLDHSNPEDGTILTTSPQKIEIWFTQPAKLTIFALLDDHEQTVPTKKRYVDPENPKHVTIELDKELPKGTYSANWQAEIGGKEKYEIFYFAVKEFSSMVGPASGAEDSLLNHIRLNQLGHWLSFLGLLTLTGGTWFLLAIAKDKGNRDRWKQYSYLLYGISMVGFLTVVISKKVEFSQAPTVDFISFSFIWISLLQIVLLSLGFWFVRGRLRLILFGLTVLLWALTGHSASPNYGGTWGIGITVLHLFSVSIWMGGLLSLFVMTPRENPGLWLKEAGKTYSKWALVSIAVMGITGLWMALKYVPSFTLESIAKSYWGEMLFIKIFLFFIIVTIGFFQRKSLKQLAENRVVPFFKRVKMELVIAVMVLIAVAVLIDLSPKEAEQGIYPQKVVQNGVEARVEISPFELGANDITVSFKNEPQYKKVRIKFWTATGWSVENTAFTLANGQYRLTGDFIHGAGTMNMEVQAIKTNGETTVFPFKIQVPGVNDTGTNDE